MSLVEFEKQKVVKSFMDTLGVYYTNLGGYHYSKDGSPCYYLNGMLIMFEEQQKKIDLLETELTETQAFLNKQNRIKQVKIHELQKQVITQGQNFNDQAQKLKDAEYFNQKLQGRIDGAMKILLAMKHNGTYKAIDILTGVGQ